MDQVSNASPVPVGESIIICEEPDTVVCLALDDGAVRWRRSISWADFAAAPIVDAADIDQQRRDLDQQLNAISEREQQLKDTGDQDGLKALRAERRRLRSQRQKLDLGGKPPSHQVNGYTSPTPVTDGSTIYVVFGTGVAAAIDFEGQPRWARIVGVPGHEWGHSASPVLVDDRLVIHIGADLMALDPATGDEVWSVSSKGTWGTPQVIRGGAGKAVLTSGGTLVRVRDGEVLAAGLTKTPWGSPVVHAGRVYIMDEAGGAAYAVNPASSGEPLQRLWTMQPKVDRYYASPVVHDGIVYNITRGGFISAVDATDGTLIYEKRLSLGGTVYPSPCLVGDQLLVCSDAGQMQIITPGRTLDVVQENTLEPFRSTPTIVDNRLYVRTLNALYCIGRP